MAGIRAACWMVLSLLALGVRAAPPSGETIATQGLPERGVTACMACHGADGAGVAGSGFPRIAGLPADYLAGQLRGYVDGQRQHPLMMPIANGLDDAQRRAVAEYYATMPVPMTSAGAPDEKLAGVAQALVQWGDWRERRLPACSQCHGRDGNGIGAMFPGIAGQHADYLKAQLLAWRDGQRKGDPQGLMSQVAAQLRDAEIDALAAWYAAQPGGRAQAAMNAQLRPTRADRVDKSHVHQGEVPDHGPTPASDPAGETGYFQPPPRWSYPAGPFGDAIRRGEQIFRRTNTDEGSGRFVGNDQACGNCHIDAGRLAHSSPLWAAYVAYPAYRTKNNKVNTFIERVQGCFKYSMNAQASRAGGPPAADTDTIVSLVAYSYWLATGAPTGNQSMPGRGYPKIAASQQAPDAQRGQSVYAEYCAICHGATGKGVVGTDGETVFPPLWGAGAYNWGAGMHRVDTAAAFIRQNMPLGLGGSLSDQQAWDLAMYINSQERPQDPRFTGDLEETRKRFHATEHSLYGKPGLDGKPLGSEPATR